jgi:hypothetical protein
MSEKLNIIDTIEKDEKFSTFARLLRTSKAVDLITGAGPFTVFVPTNDAFGKVPDAQMNGWTSQTDQTSLAKVLSNHIVASKLFASNLNTDRPAATLAGSEMNFTDKEGLRVNGARVQARNIEATNGVIHVLDTVLTLPTNAVAASAATAGAGTTTAPVTIAATPPTTQADGHSDAPAAAATEVTPNVIPETAKPVVAPLPMSPTPSVL